jgi:6-phosphogluconolactonase
MIWLYDDYAALGDAAAGIFVQQARQAAQIKGWFSVALAGGHTPHRTYQLLAQPRHSDRTPWGQIHIFWGDERCVPADDVRSNARMARQAMLDQVPIPLAQIHPIPCSRSPKVAAEQYEGVLQAFFGDQPPRFDLVLLGLGEDGHTASLFPGTRVLEEQERWTAAVHVEEQDTDRVTLTAPLINQAAVVVFLVSGTGKAAVLREVLEGPVDPNRLPAQLIQPAGGELHWLLDREAASLLTRRV